MLWAIFALLAAFVHSIVNIVDKIAVSKEMKDPIFATAIFGGIMFVAFGLIGFFVDIMIPYTFILASFIAGIFSWFAVYLYYKILIKEEVSKFMPILSLGPLFVMTIAYFFLNEVLTMLDYVGIFVLVSGAFIMSLKEFKLKFGLKEGFLIILATILLFSLEKIAIKFASLSVSIWPVMFWAGIGEGIVAFFAFILHKAHIKGKVRKKGVEHLIIANVLTILGAALAFIAISLGPVSLVSAISKVQMLFIFLGTTMLTKFYPRILKEKFTKKIIIQKIIAIALIIAGAILVI
jgi:uncharacterized membrane protein